MRVWSWSVCDAAGEDWERGTPSTFYADSRLPREKDERFRRCSRLVLMLSDELDPAFGADGSILGCGDTEDEKADLPWCIETMLHM